VTTYFLSEETAHFSTPAGEIVGWLDGDVVRASGIAYARAGRFQPPHPEPPAPLPIDATTSGPGCPQTSRPTLDALLGGGMVGYPTDEDCLRLSVTRPASPSHRARPVMVWIHGGSYIAGAGDLPAYDPRLLVTEQDVVVVNVTFRLGLFGFLGGFEDRPANLGLLDLLAALRWIRTNIAAFGGDPDNVTLFGESAGADAIAHLMIADNTEGLFHRVILQSPPLGISRGRSQMYAEMGAAAAAIGPATPVEEVLRHQAGVEAVARRHGLRRAMPFGVHYGQAPLPAEDELNEAWRRAAARFDVLIGTNDEEVALYAAFIPAMMKLASVPVIGRRLRDLLIRQLTEAVYGSAADRLASLLADGGARAYRYRLHWGRGRTPMGACHMMDLPLVLGTPEVWADSELVQGLPLQEIREAGAQVRAVWADFARTGRLASEGRIEPEVLSWNHVTTRTLSASAD
jgi:para-nitrobenzyl esterase